MILLVGDVVQEIEAGVAFDVLPDEYCCSVCESPKTYFKSMILAINA